MIETQEKKRKNPKSDNSITDNDRQRQERKSMR
jgi:hypothetical protein